MPAEGRGDVQLRDGTVVRIRIVGPKDRFLIHDLFEHLSLASQYLRFFSPRPHVPPEEIDPLLGAGPGFGVLAVAKDRAVGFVSVHPREPGTGEFAIVVSDDHQGKGLGRILMERMLDVAQRRGFDTVRGDVLLENRRMLALLRSLDRADVHAVFAEGVIRAVMTLERWSARPTGTGGV